METTTEKIIEKKTEKTGEKRAERGPRRPRAFKSEKREKSEFDQKILDIARVTRVMAGGRRFSFRIAAVIGDRNGRVGVGVAKGGDVSLAMEKAVNDAKKRMIRVNIFEGTIPHEVEVKKKSARVLLRPAVAGRGIVAGGAVRVVCEFAGIKNISAKVLSKSKNKINNARATVEALKMLKFKKSAKKIEAKEIKPENAEKEGENK
ncbi:30S ribosomal protein S5 [Candidatus Azambacteria bacterium]|nr:30S ribosomal protein S5 [Candidatus Azambacteria bacterium]